VLTFWAIRRAAWSALFEVRPWLDDPIVGWAPSGRRLLAVSIEGARRLLPAGAAWAHVDLGDPDGDVEWWSALAAAA
jgi:hypothetical protein